MERFAPNNLNWRYVLDDTQIYNIVILYYTNKCNDGLANDLVCTKEDNVLFHLDDTI